MDTHKRRLGIPRSDEERRIRHSILYPGEELPSRGTGLRGESVAGSKNSNLVTAVLGSLILLFLASLIRAISSARESRRIDSGAES